MATVVQLLQGMIAGVSILAVGVGLLYVTSLSGSGINLVVNGTVVELSASRQQVDPAADIPEVAEEPSSAESNHENLTTATEITATADFDPLSAISALDYYNLVAPDLSALMVSFGRLGRMLENPRPEEEGWRNDVTQVIDLLEDAYTRLSLLTIPPDASEVHRFLMESTGRCLGVTDTLSSDLTTVPSDLFPVLGKTLTRCTENIKQVATEIQ